MNPEETDGVSVDRSEVIDATLDRMGLERRPPSREALCELLERHVATFPFCSVGPRLGEDLPLDLPALYDRIVTRRRGGYCFELNALLYAALEELGYAVELVLARVIYDQDIHPGLTHRLSLVELDGSTFLVDGGFGPQGPAVPVDLSGAEARFGASVYRVLEVEPRHYRLQVFKDGAFFSLYKFERSRYGQADCELGHFYSHKHPKAAFVNHLVVSKILPGEVRSLRNRGYRLITAEGFEDTKIRDPAHLRTILAEDFEIAVTEEESRRLF